MQVTVGNLKVTLVKDQDNDGKIHSYIRVDGYLSMSGILLYLVIDGIMWLSLFAVIMR